VAAGSSKVKIGGAGQSKTAAFGLGQASAQRQPNAVSVRVRGLAGEQVRVMPLAAHDPARVGVPDLCGTWPATEFRRSGPG
jgi:hypothetical protein